MRDIALQAHRYYTTVDQGGRSRRYARFNAPNYQSGKATGKLSNRYPPNKESVPRRAHITKESHLYYYGVLREGKEKCREPLPKQVTSGEPLRLFKRLYRVVDKATGLLPTSIACALTHAHIHTHAHTHSEKRKVNNCSLQEVQEHQANHSVLEVKYIFFNKLFLKLKYESFNIVKVALCTS